MKERKCLQCGGNRFKELKGGLRKCLYCGTTVQYEFRKAEKQVVEQPREHYLTIISQGVFLIMDAKVNVEINGISSGRFSLRDGFVVKVPTTKIMVVRNDFLLRLVCQHADDAFTKTVDGREQPLSFSSARCQHHMGSRLQILLVLHVFHVAVFPVRLLHDTALQGFRIII